MYEFILNILRNFDTRFSQLNRQEGNRNVFVFVFWRSVFVSWILGFGFGDVVGEKRKRETAKKKETVHCLQANPALPQGEGPPRGNSREFFSAHFGGCSRFSRNKRL